MNFIYSHHAKQRLYERLNRSSIKFRSKITDYKDRYQSPDHMWHLFDPNNQLEIVGESHYGGVFVITTIIDTDKQRFYERMDYQVKYKYIRNAQKRKKENQ